MQPVDDNLEIHCFCRRSPLLARCGRDTRSGELFVHVRSAKKDRINAEVVVTSGTVRVRCRDCSRWHTITIKQPNVQHKPEGLPDSIRI